MWGVQSLSIRTEGYIADVAVNLDRGGAFDADLADDDTFTEAVIDRLRQAGYNGHSFGRCELGMQGDRCVMLEPNADFTAFAVGKGFKRLTF